jgi:branched-subunit amino acid ABC-type transport system permease component
MRIWLAGLLIALGLVWLLDAADALSAPEVLDRWWPVALIALAVIAAISERRVGLGPAVLFVVGGLLLVDQLDLVEVGAILWPSVAVVAGVWLLLHRGRWGGEREQVSDRQDVVALLGGSSTKSRAAHFRHADVFALFGGATLDLRDAHLDPGASVEALAVFGGVDVIVPEGWRVTVSGLPIFGGYEDKTRGNGDLPPDAPELRVSATAVFGAVNVKNPVPV